MWEPTDTSSIIATVAVASLVMAWFISTTKNKQSLKNYKEPPMVPGGVPIFGHALAFAQDPKNFLLSCHEKYGGVFQVRLVFKTFVFTDGSHRDLYFSLPEKTLSFDQALLENGVASDSTVGRDCVTSPWHIPILKRALTEKNMTLYTERIERQVYKALEQFGINMTKDVVHMEQSTIIENLQPLAWKIVANSSGTSFLGEDLIADNPQVVQVFLEFHEACLKVIAASNFVPESMLWLVATEIRKHRQILRQVIIPEIEKRRATLTSENNDKDNNENNDADLPQDILAHMIKTGRSSTELADRFMAFIFASMITTAGAMTNSLNDLAGYQDQWPVLLEEQENVMKKHGAGITQDAMDQMPRLHAFVWESIRCAALPVQQTRIAAKEGIELEPGSGIYLPPGAMVAISGVLANTLVPDSSIFLPERFLKADGGLVDDPASLGFFPFGIGRHYCPGRFFALAEIKVALAVLLRNFRFKTVSGNVPKYSFEPADVKRVAEPVEFTRVATLAAKQ